MKTFTVEVISAFMVLFAVIDILGSIPIILKYKQEGKEVHPFKITLTSFVILIIFLFGGKLVLGLFGVDISSFAIAGAIVIFFVAFEMIFGMSFFKDDSVGKSSIVPIAFPLIAGAGSITTLISLRAEFSLMAILLALILNMVFVYVVLKLTRTFEKLLGPTGLLIVKKVFGIILLAIAIKLFMTNTGIQLPK